LKVGGQVTPKQQRAIEIRDAALKKLRSESRFVEVRGLGRCTEWSKDGLQISLRTPFQKLPPISESMQLFAASVGRAPVNLPYGIDVWDLAAKRKVFNAEWADSGEFCLVTFRCGEWENKLM
jgi:hypothetical protein